MALCSCAHISGFGFLPSPNNPALVAAQLEILEYLTRELNSMYIQFFKITSEKVHYLIHERVQMHSFFHAPICTISLFPFQNSNSRSEPLNLISTLKYAWRPNFIFFWKFFTIFLDRYKITVFGPARGDEALKSFS